MSKKDTTIKVSKNMARVLKQIKNTEEYRSINTVLKQLLHNSNIELPVEEPIQEQKKEDQQNGTPRRDEQREEPVTV